MKKQEKDRNNRLAVRLLAMLLCCGILCGIGLPSYAAGGDDSASTDTASVEVASVGTDSDASIDTETDPTLIDQSGSDDGSAAADADTSAGEADVNAPDAGASDTDTDSTTDANTASTDGTDSAEDVSGEDANGTEGADGTGENAEGEGSEGEGENAEGENAEGEGENAEGENAEGEGSEGESSEGEGSEGETTGETSEVEPYTVPETYTFTGTVSGDDYDATVTAYNYANPEYDPTAAAAAEQAAQEAAEQAAETGETTEENTNLLTTIGDFFTNTISSIANAIGLGEDDEYVPAYELTAELTEISYDSEDEDIYAKADAIDFEIEDTFLNKGVVPSEENEDGERKIATGYSVEFRAYSINATIGRKDGSGESSLINSDVGVTMSYPYGDAGCFWLSAEDAGYENLTASNIKTAYFVELNPSTYEVATDDNGNLKITEISASNITGTVIGTDGLYAIVVVVNVDADASETSISGLTVNDIVDTIENDGRYSISITYTDAEGTTHTDVTGEEAADVLKAAGYSVSWTMDSNAVALGQTLVTETGNKLSSDEDGGWVNVGLLQGSQKTFVVTVSKDGSSLTATKTCQYYGQLMNGDFESPKVNSGYVNTYTKTNDGSASDYWQTTAGAASSTPVTWGGASEAYTPYVEIGSENGTTWASGNAVYSYGPTSVSVSGSGRNKTITYGITAAGGDQYAELNAEGAGALYQTVLTMPGQTMNWQFYHRARTADGAGENWSSGSDEMAMLIVPEELADKLNLTTQTALENFYYTTLGLNFGSNNGTVEYTYEGKTYTIYVCDDTASAQAYTYQDGQETKKIGYSTWNKRTGTFVVPDDQYLTRFFFMAISTAYTKANNLNNYKTVGNLLDEVAFTQNALPIDEGSAVITVTKVVSGLSEADAKTVLGTTGLITSSKSGETVALTGIQAVAGATDTWKATYSVTITGLQSGGSSESRTYTEDTNKAEVNGYTCSTEVYVGSEKQSGAAGTVTVSYTIQSGSITFYNNYTPDTASLTIKKTVAGSTTDGTPTAASLSGLTYKFTLKDASGNAVPVTKQNDGSYKYDSTSTNTEIEITYPANNTSMDAQITVSGLTAGATYYVEEVTSGIATPTGYYLVAGSPTYTAGGTNETASSTAADHKVELTTSGATVTVTNTYEPYKITIKKTVSNVTTSINETYKFKVYKVTTENDVETKTLVMNGTSETWDITISGTTYSATKEITGLTAGTYYIEEVNDEKYAIDGYYYEGIPAAQTITLSTGSATDGQKTVTMTNVYHNEDTLTIKKLVTGNFVTSTDKSANYTFTITSCKVNNEDQMALLKSINNWTESGNPTVTVAGNNTTGTRIKVPAGAVIELTETAAGGSTALDKFTASFSIGTTNGKTDTITVDGDKELTVTNNYDVTIDNGVLLDSAPYIVLLAVVAAAAVVIVVRRRRTREDD